MALPGRVRVVVAPPPHHPQHAFLGVEAPPREAWGVPFLTGCAVGLVVAMCCWFWQKRRTMWKAAALLRPGKKRLQRKLMRRGLGVEANGGDEASAGVQPSGSGCSREVLNEDAVPWLESLGERGLPANCCVVTGVPDIHEVDPEGKNGIDWYCQWFRGVVELVLQRLPEGSLAIFMQTDIKVQKDNVDRATARMGKEGHYWRWVDKAHLAMLAAEKVPGARLLWHKIIFSGLVGGGGGRNSAVSGYSHFFCFTTGPDPEPLDSFPFQDVVRKGLSTWVAGSGAQATEEVCIYLYARGCELVVDPFCGEGAVLAIANSCGMASLGVELSKKRAKTARRQDGDSLLAADRAERPPGTRGALD